jgi:rare lipoprotein A
MLPILVLSAVETRVSTREPAGSASPDSIRAELVRVAAASQVRAGAAPSADARVGVGQPTTPARSSSKGRIGLATYYGTRFDGRMTASGVPFDPDAMIAAHPTYAFGTVVRVTNLRNGRSAQVEIVDRGPSRGARSKGVIIDVSRAAAESLGFLRAGRARVRLEVLSSP